MQSTAADHTPQEWSAVAQRYDHQFYPFTTQYAADALAAVPVHAGERVLDLAAGTGAMSVLAARTGADVTAVDSSQGMLRVLDSRLKKERLPNIRIRPMDGQALSLLDKRFDAAFSIFGLIFFPDRAKGFGELKRVLKRGGKVAVTSWCAPEKAPFLALARDAAARAGLTLSNPAVPPAVLSLADPTQFEAELTAAGFHDVKVVQLDHTWDVPTPEAYFDSIDGTSPVFAPTLDEIGPEHLPAVKAALVDLIRERYGPGPVRIPAAAWLGTGTA
ncbi:MAG: methyltransferase domain-containing protein [Candidatus Thermoplasmatota archaeon]